MSLMPDYDGDMLDCRIQVEGKVLEGPATAAGSAVDVTMIHGGQVKTAQKPEFICTIKRGAVTKLLAKAECGKKEVVRFVVKALNPKV